MFNSRLVFCWLKISVIFFIIPASSWALDVKISPEIEFVAFKHDNKEYKVQRIQNQEHLLTGGFSKTSRMCPPFCVQPMEVAPDIKTVGELELLTFIKTELSANTGVLVDARTPSWYGKGTIPGSVNIPFTTFSKKSSHIELKKVLYSLGVKKRDTKSLLPSLMEDIKRMVSSNYVYQKWDFSSAKKLLLWCNGMWCGQSPAAIKGLIELGYPSEKILYYRGGMQAWKSLGLNVVIPERS